MFKKTNYKVSYYKNSHNNIVILFYCCLLVTMVFSIFATQKVMAHSFAPPFSLQSEGVYLVNLNTDTVIYQKNENQKQIPASIVKIMTTIVVLENTADLNQKLTATYDVFNDLYGKSASNAGLVPGEEMAVIDLLYGLMLKSGCDAAGVLAREVGGGDPAQFVAMMNQKAQEIGAKNTLFVDPHGLDTATQRSTPYDIYLITQYALGLPKFKEIATARYHELPPTNKRGATDQTRYWTHTNLLLNPNSSLYNPYVMGIKTGTAADEKGLVSMAQKDGNTYLLILMGATKYNEKGNVVETAMIESNTVYKWLFATFSMRSLVDYTQYYTELPVALAKDRDYVLGVPAQDVLAFLPKDSDDFNLKEDVEYLVSADETLTAPVAKGEVIATLSFLYQGEHIDTVDLVAATSVNRSTFKFIKNEFSVLFTSLSFRVVFFLLIFLIVLYIVFMIKYNRAKRQRKKYKNRNI